MNYEQDAQRLNAERRATEAELSAIVTKIGNRSLTAEESRSIETHKNIINDIERRLAQALEGAKTMSRSNELDNIIGRAGSNEVAKNDQEVRDMIRDTGQATLELRDLTTSTESVTTSYADRASVLLTEGVPLLTAPTTKMRDNTARDIVIPTVTATGAATLISEAGAFQESDHTSASVTFTNYKYGKLIQVSSELDRSGQALDLIVIPTGVKSVAAALAAAFSTGSGSGQPQGIFDAATGETAAGVNSVTADELHNLQASVAPEYRNSASAGWVMSDTVWQQIRLLKDSNARYLASDGGGLQAPEVPMLLGKPVYLNSNSPAPTTGLDSVAFGDLSYFWIRIGREFKVDRSESYAFAEDLISYRISFETDSHIMDANAIKVLTQA